jgi:hypothetical protein
MIRKITSVKVKGFVLTCRFSPGEVVEYDMKVVRKETGTVAKALHKPKFFSKVFLDAGVPTWPNGYDVCPDLIFEKGKKVGSGKSA